MTTTPNTSIAYLALLHNASDYLLRGHSGSALELGPKDTERGHSPSPQGKLSVFKTQVDMSPEYLGWQVLYQRDKQDTITVLRRQGLLVLSVLGPAICSSEPSQHSVIIERATPAKGPRAPFLGVCLESGGSGLWKPSQGSEFPDRKARKPLFKLLSG